jgi:hypothetical protein
MRRERLCKPFKGFRFSSLCFGALESRGGSLGDAGGAERDESVTDVLRRVDHMMAAMGAMGSGSADKAGIGEIEAEEEGWMDGRCICRCRA